MTTISWGQFNAITGTASKGGSEDHQLGFGLNYTWPSTGLSCRMGFDNKFKGQASLAFRNYGSYSWSFFGVELNYIVNETDFDFGNLEGFGYAGIGRGTISFKDQYYQTLGLENYNWIGFNVGVGAELFPDAFKNKIGIIGKLGFGSYGTYGVETATAMGLLFGGAVHYYIK